MEIFGFDYEDLYCFDGKNFLIYNKSPAFVNESEKLERNPSGDYFTTMIEDREGFFWFGTAGNGVLRFDGEQVIHITKDNGLMDNHIGVIFQTTTGEFWFGRVAVRPHLPEKEFRVLSLIIRKAIFFQGH